MKNPADIPPEETAPNPKTPDWSGLGDLSGSTLPCPRCNAPQSRVAQRDGSRQWWSCDSYGYGGKVKDQSALCSEREEHNETRREISRLAELLRCHHDEPCTVIVLRQDSEIQRLRAQLESQIEETQIAATGDLLSNAPHHPRQPEARTDSTQKS